MTTSMRVGDLAKRTGLTVRTLHHYDAIGLLRPSTRTSTGHRLYGKKEVERLQHITSLRYLGLSLDEIRDCLTKPEHSIERALEMQIERIEEQIGRQTRLRALVQHLRDRLRTAEGASVDELTRTIEVTIMHEKYYSPEQLRQLEQRRAEVGDDRIQEAQREWQELFTACKKAMDEGLDPTCEEMKALARKRAALIREFTGGDLGIAASLANMYRSEGPANVLARHGMQVPSGLFEYMDKATAALRSDA
jgi:DNA-binding transcriptional MerR regulator